MGEKRFFSTLGMLLLLLPGCKKNINKVKVSDVINHNILSSLGVKERQPPDKYYDAELYSFVGEFLKDAEIRGVEISQASIDKLRQVKYVDELSSKAEEGVIASCSRYYIDEKSIVGSKMRVQWTIIEVLRAETDAFTQGSHIRLRELIYHEIFHCLMNKGHLPEGISGIMSPTFVEGDKRAFNDWDGLVNDMFSRKFIDMIPDSE